MCSDLDRPYITNSFLQQASFVNNIFELTLILSQTELYTSMKFQFIFILLSAALCSFKFDVNILLLAHLLETFIFFMAEPLKAYVFH